MEFLLGAIVFMAGVLVGGSLVQSTINRILNRDSGDI